MKTFLSFFFFFYCTCTRASHTYNNFTEIYHTHAHSNDGKQWLMNNDTRRFKLNSKSIFSFHFFSSLYVCMWLFMQPPHVWTITWFALIWNSSKSVSVWRDLNYTHDSWWIWQNNVINWQNKLNWWGKYFFYCVLTT